MVVPGKHAAALGHGREMSAAAAALEGRWRAGSPEAGSAVGPSLNGLDLCSSGR